MFSLHPLFFLFSYSCSFLVAMSYRFLPFCRCIFQSLFYLRVSNYNCSIFCISLPLSACYSNCGNFLWNICIFKAEVISSVIFRLLLVQRARTYYISSSTLEFFTLKTLSMIRKKNNCQESQLYLFFISKRRLFCCLLNIRQFEFFQ